MSIAEIFAGLFWPFTAFYAKIVNSGKEIVLFLVGFVLGYPFVLAADKLVGFITIALWLIWWPTMGRYFRDSSIPMYRVIISDILAGFLISVPFFAIVFRILGWA